MRESHTRQIEQEFFGRILSLAEKYGGESLIERFKNVKRERERYLKEQWTESSDLDLESAVFRDIDYQYLITLLQENLKENAEQRFTVFSKVIRLCIQYGEYEKGRVLFDYMRVHEDKKSHLAQLLRYEGSILFRRQDFERSLQKYEQALQLFSELDDIYGMAKIYNFMGIASHENWEHGQGENYFQKAYDLALKDGDTTFSNSIRINLAIDKLIKGETEEGIDIIDDMLAQKDELDLPEKEFPLLLLNKGFGERDRGNYEKARECFEESLKLVKDSRLRRTLSSIYSGYAESLILCKNYERAEEYLYKAFKIHAELHNQIHLGDDYKHYAMLHTRLKYFDLAEAEFKISIRLGKENGSLSNLAETYHAFSYWAKVQGMVERQKLYLEQAISLCETIEAYKRADKHRKELEAIE